MTEQITPATLNAWRLELADSTTEDLEQIAGTHFMLNDACPPRSWIRQRQALAREVLEIRQTQESGQAPHQKGIQ